MQREQYNLAVMLADEMTMPHVDNWRIHESENQHD